MTQQEIERFTARVEYGKRGALRFIGHLDTVRLIVRAVRAARFPVCYSQGHSPHPLVAFGPPLPVGTTSDSEFFDVRLTEPLDPAAARSALATHVPSGIEVRAVRLMTGKPESLGAWLDRADYTVSLPAGLELGPECIQQFLESESVIVTRTRRERTTQVNVRRWVERLDMVSAPDGTTGLEMTIAMTPQGSTNPLEVLRALAGPDAAPRPGIRVHRARLYHADDPPTSEKATAAS